MTVQELIEANKLVEDLREELRDEMFMSDSFSSGFGDKVDGFQIWLTGGAVNAHVSGSIGIYCRVSINGVVHKFDKRMQNRDKSSIMKEIADWVVNTVAQHVTKELINSDEMNKFLELMYQIK